MPTPPPDIGEDIAHQHLMWKVERSAWLLITLALFAALAGFIGHGPFSERTEVSNAGFSVTYQRFERYHAQSQFALRVSELRGDRVRIRLGREFVSKVEITRIEPEPAGSELGAGFVSYDFDAATPGTVQFHYRPLHIGALRLAIGRDDAPLLSLPLFVWP